MESLKTRLEFPSPVIQAQTVRSLVAAVLKEKGSDGQITWSCAQGPALEALWQQCCSDCAVVCSACCDTLVLLVDQGHADLDYILNGVLNLLPSARHTQGLIKVIRRLLEMQADQSDGHFTCPYSIRSSPHPYVTALENRVDCWPALLFEIDDFIQKAVDRDKEAYITMLAPFLRYLYCQPHRQPEHALLRQSLLRVMLPIQGGSRSAPQNKEQETLSPVSDRLLLCLCQLVPHMQVDSVEAVLELCAFVGALLQDLTGTSGDQWKPEKAALALQLLCACRRCLEFNGDCRPIIGLMQQLVPACQVIAVCRQSDTSKDKEAALLCWLT